MIQKLFFEPAWDKTIASIDREKIIHHFHRQTKYLKEGIDFSFLWKADNHKGEQLITVLIHNYEETAFCLQNTVLTYHEQGQAIVTGIFNLPCKIGAKTSMPWTLIFSESNLTSVIPHYTIRNDKSAKKTK